MSARDLAAIVAVLLLAVVLPPQAAAQADEETAEAAPDVGRVWLRVPKASGIKRSANRSGALEIGEEALRFIGRKKTVELPYAAMHTVSFGRMEGDVDTVWTVIELDDGEGRRLYGLRDGSKLGFGQRTPAIHERLIELVRRERHAQYGVPDETRLYDAFDWQFTLARPDDWAVRIGELVYLGDRAPWGSLLILPGSAASTSDASGVDDRQIEQVRTGALAAVTIERRQAPRGARCGGFTTKARRAILAHLAESRFGDGSFAGPAVAAESADAIDGCASLRIVAGSTDAPIEMRAVAFGDVLYLIGVRRASGADDAFEAAVTTLRFAKAL